MPAFRLAHLSDLHLPPPAGSEVGLRLKQRLSRFAWRRKGKRHDRALLDRIVADIAAAEPDHIAITGDLTNFSTSAEYAQATAFLRSLGPAERLTVSPGNHDALVGTSGAQPFAPWQNWLGDGTETTFPYVRRRGPVAIVNLCSAVPTGVHSAQGELGPEQLTRLRSALGATEGRFRVVLIHHPPTRGIVKPRADLRDQTALHAVLREAGAELVLHGHAHRAVVASLAGPNGPIPVLGVPSASALPGHGDAARWHLFEIEQTDAGFDVTVIARGLGPDGTIAELGRYRMAPQLTDSVSGSGSRSLQPSH